jgi:hypothetical protein
VKIYIDNCVFNRLFDDKSQPRIWLEVQAMQKLIELIKNGGFSLVVSQVNEWENTENPQPIRKKWVDDCFKLASRKQPVTQRCVLRAQELESSGVKGLDALHAACAEEAGAMYLITCDDVFIKKYTGGIAVINPADFILKYRGNL